MGATLLAAATPRLGISQLLDSTKTETTTATATRKMTPDPRPQSRNHPFREPALSSPSVERRTWAWRVGGRGQEATFQTQVYIQPPSDGLVAELQSCKVYLARQTNIPIPEIHNFPETSTTSLATI